MSSYINKAVRMVRRNLLRHLHPRYKLNHRGGGTINYIDVGSIGSLPAPWDSNANRIRFLLNFEPGDRPKRGADFMTCDTALWEENATRPFHVYRGFRGTGSSLLEQDLDYVRENWDRLREHGPARLANTWFERSQLVETREVKCRTLDEVLTETMPSTSFHFLKIDAQGAEYSILKGARNLLSTTCVGLHLELFVVPLYKGVVLLDEVKEYLESFGFALVKKFAAHGTFDSQHDCLFLHDQRDPGLSGLIRQTYGIGRTNAGARAAD